MRTALFSIFLVVLGAPAVAAAGATPMPAPPTPMPAVMVYGPVVVESVSLEIGCAGIRLHDASASCRVTMSAWARALEPAELMPPASDATTLFDGEPAPERRPLEPGEVVHVEMSFVRELNVETRDPEMPWIVYALRARHMFLGESTSTREEGGGATGPMFEGMQLQVRGPVHVDATAAGDVQVTVGPIPVDGVAEVDGGLGLSLQVPLEDATDRLVLHGGPYLAAGFTGPIDESEGFFAMRVGYELGLTDFLVLGVAFETDFDSIAESVLVEAALPEAMIILPSISAGVGAVFRQLGQRDADAALRLHLGYQIMAVGAYADFDYWPAIGDWTIAAGARISI